MTHFTRRLTFEADKNSIQNTESFLKLEWLVTNGLGGYSSSTLIGINTRRYHGLLVAALPPPFGRTLLFNQLLEQVIFPDGTRYCLSCVEKSGSDSLLEGMNYLREFRLEDGLPVWLFNIGEVWIEKRVVMIHLQNTVHISYRLLQEGPVLRLNLQPAFHFRSYEGLVNTPLTEPYVIKVVDHRYEISTKNYPPLSLKIDDDQVKFSLESLILYNTLFSLEANRGYEAMGDLWSPGYFQADLRHDRWTTLLASTESWETIEALNPQEAFQAETIRRARLFDMAPPQARTGLGGELIYAADQFIILPASRVVDAARAYAEGEEIRTVIAGYHWFTDWGRDTMIALEGLTLSTGRYLEAKWILGTFKHYVHQGLIPNMFPDGQNAGLYHTADATLWFFHAVDRYISITQDRQILQQLLPTLISIAEHHLQGTLFGIGVDPGDGLLKQGAVDYQLTWMDAKVGDWVVTPRRGKAVEINALWYNALKLLENWLKAENRDKEAGIYMQHADRAFHSFNQRFWYAEGGYLYDVIDGMDDTHDTACRPNQLFAISLAHPILKHEHWNSVVETVEKHLLTPFGLRTLAPDHPDYKSLYDGDLRARDAAYHQGTVWAWLMGPFIDAWIKIHPEKRTEARRFLESFQVHLEDAGIGTHSEIFDAIEPYTARGCIAQAWSVAEILRCWIKTA